MRCKYFLEWVELLIALWVECLGDSFHLRFHHFKIFALWPWWRVETLRGKCFQSEVGRDLVSLESPQAAFLASSSACLFGLKLQ
jgi:hypothetical protein